MPPFLYIPIAVGLAACGYFIFARSRRGNGPDAARIEAMQFGSAREVLVYMQQQRIGYIAVEGGGKWEAKDLRQQGIVNLLRSRYFELHNAEQRQYFSEVSENHVEQARVLMARRPAQNLRGYRQQLMKLMIYVKDPDCRQEIQSELAAIATAVEEEQVRSALASPPAEIDDEHLALLENFLESNPRFTLARELEAEIERVKGILGARS
ncbi:MAG: hypothetical protein H7A35_01750 [Planctomycetales bacterium]|nr:hypothetical protein [bacterium]UNM08782.1 MAG: hypothetical protein H7A35_01750 [Planctomycetales bacterium]